MLNFSNSFRRNPLFFFASTAQKPNSTIYKTMLLELYQYRFNTRSARNLTIASYFFFNDNSNCPILFYEEGNRNSIARVNAKIMQREWDTCWVDEGRQCQQVKRFLAFQPKILSWSVALRGRFCVEFLNFNPFHGSLVLDIGPATYKF